MKASGIWPEHVLIYKVRQYSFAVSNAEVRCQRSVSVNGVGSCIAQSYIVNNAHMKGVESCIAQAYETC